MLRLENCLIENGGFALRADLEIAPGSRIAVIGPSGAGKSTLIEALAGFRPLSKGAVLWNGKDLSKIEPGKRPIAMLFQDGNLFPHLTVVQNVGLGIHSNLCLDDAQQAKVQAALTRVGLGSMRDR